MSKIRKVFVIVAILLALIGAAFFLSPYETYYTIERSKSNMLGVTVAPVTLPVWLGWVMEKCDLAVSKERADQMAWERAKQQLEWIKQHPTMTEKEKQEAKDWVLKGLGNNKYIPKD